MHSWGKICTKRYKKDQKNPTAISEELGAQSRYHEQKQGSAPGPLHATQPSAHPAKRAGVLSLVATLFCGPLGSANKALPESPVWPLVHSYCLAKNTSFSIIPPGVLTP